MATIINQEPYSNQVVIIGGFVLNSSLFDYLLINLNCIYFDINLQDNISSLDELVQNLHNVIMVNNLDKIIILAYSLGGLVGIKYLHQYNNKVQKLVLLNSSPRFIEDNNWHGVSVENFNKLRLKLVNTSFNNFINYFVKLVSYPQSVTVLYDLVDLDKLQHNKPHLFFLLDLFKVTDLRDICTIPININKTYFIYAKNDILVPCNSIAESNYIIIENAGHILTQQIFIKTINKIIKI